MDFAPAASVNKTILASQTISQLTAGVHLINELLN